MVAAYTVAIPLSPVFIEHQVYFDINTIWVNAI